MENNVGNKILENGFLDEKLNLSVKEIRMKNEDAYSLAYELNNLLYEIEKKFVDKTANNRDIYIYTIFNQIHISCQTYLLLVERGLYADSQVILRSIYDKIFNMIMVVKDETYLHRLLKKALNENLNISQRIKDKGLFDIVSQNNLDLLILQYEEKLAEMKKIKGPYDNASLTEKVGMQRHYIYYKLLSKYTHSELTILLNQLIFKEEGIIINGGQVYIGKIPEEILRYVECVELIVKAIDEYLKINNFKKILEIELKYEYIWKNMYS